MTPDDDRLEPRLDELYGLPLDDFTRARGELARELRQAGDRAGADHVKALRKPSVVAWALNQVQRQHRERVEQLLLAGEQLREAQTQLLAGAEHGTLRDAVARERALIDELAQLAEHQLAQAGHAPSVTVQNKLWQTLQAAARDEQTRSLLSRGRLLKEGQITDLGLGGLGDAVAGERPPPAAEKPAADRPAADKPAARRERGRERELKAARDRLERAREQQDSDQRELARLEQTAAQARQQAERAQAAAARASDAAERAGVRAAQATERVRELEAALRKLEAGA